MTWYRLVDKIIVHSTANRDELHQLFNVPHEKITVIPHGNYDLLIKAHDHATVVSREHLNISEDDDVLLFFGAIRKYKGLDVLLRAFRRAIAKRKNLKLIIAGPLSIYDDQDIEYYESTIDNYGLRGAVILRFGYVPMHVVPDYFRLADVAILPYLITYHSGVIHLAFAFGLPVVASRTGGIPEMVEHEDCGILVNAGDEKALAAAIAKIFESDIQMMGQRALALSNTKYSWSSIAQRTKALYLD